MINGLFALLAAPFALLSGWGFGLCIRDVFQGAGTGEMGATCLFLIFFSLFSYVLFLAGSASLKRMEYDLGYSALSLHYGHLRQEVPYDGIREIRKLRHREFFDGGIRDGGKSILHKPYGLETAEVLFDRYDHLRLGPVFLCVTTAKEYVIIFFRESQAPALLISPERINDFLTDLESRLRMTPLPV